MNFQEIIIQQAETIQQLGQFLIKKTLQFEAEIEGYKKRLDQYEQAYNALQHQLKGLLRHRFGKKSERFLETVDSLIPSAASDLPADNLPDADIEPESKKKRHKTAVKSNKKRSDPLPCRIEIIEASAEDKQCTCGACKEVIRYETKQLIHYTPAHFEMVEQRREVVACMKGCDDSLKIAPAPLQVLPKSKATPELLAFLVTSKLEDRQPLYHLEKQLAERHGIDCSRQTMARWLIELTEPMQPLYNLLKDPLIEYDIAGTDATTLQVLNEPGRLAETKSYIYCMRGGSPEHAVILYDYNYESHQAFVKTWFEGFTGYLQVDGDNFFDHVGKIALLVCCMAHARRKFEAVADSGKGQGTAKEALRFFKELYRIERDAKDRGLTATERYTLRQEKSKPLLEKFKTWLDTTYVAVLPKSPLGNAMYYCLKRWKEFTRFLLDGRLEIDNNLTEQEIKPFVIARKNFLFSSSMDGARALCQHLSFIRTAKKHGLEPYHYYVKVLKSLPYCSVVEDYEKLLPWNIQMA
jgi:transposase